MDETGWFVFQGYQGEVVRRKGDGFLRLGSPRSNRWGVGGLSNSITLGRSGGEVRGSGSEVLPVSFVGEATRRSDSKRAAGFGVVGIGLVMPIGCGAGGTNPGVVSL